MDAVDSITDCAAQLRRHLALSRSQAWVLALWSVGVLLAGQCGQSVVSHLLAALLDQKPNTLRQRLREFTYEAPAKRGAKRCAVAVDACFAGLLRWVLELWRGPRLALALDATSLKQDLVVLCVSALVRGAAVPVAWRVLHGNRPQAWKPHWLALLDHVRGVVPASCEVLVLTDRGLYAPWLFEALVGVGFHPLMRIQAGGYFCPAGEGYAPIATFAERPGGAYRGRGVAFKDHPVACTLLAQWPPGYEEPWRLITDLAPDRAYASWYALRAWIEQGFKDLKRGGLHWQHTRMKDPERVQRFWLVLAVASLWAVSVGGAQDETAARRSPAPPPRRRRGLSVFRQGCLRILTSLLRREPRHPPVRLKPEPWPPPWGTPDCVPG